MDEYLNYYMNKLDEEAQSHDDEPPLPMTPERAQALIAADADGVGMAETLIEQAYFVAYEELLETIKQDMYNTLLIASIILMLNIPPKSQVNGTVLVINYLSRDYKCPYCHKAFPRTPFAGRSGLRVGHNAPFVHEDCFIRYQATPADKRKYYAKQVLEGKVRKGRLS